ncbi:GLUG motif-containing protein (plasmid) [Halorutilales archaeon Cl-col2-1]
MSNDQGKRLDESVTRDEDERRALVQRQSKKASGKLRAVYLVSLVLVSVLALSTGGAGTAAANAPDAGNYSDILDGMEGNGTADSPYNITNVTELQAVAGDLDANYTVAGDIDASNTSSWNGGDGFAPIGNETTPFTGSFDGSGYAITGLYINRSRESADGTGLFGRSGSGAMIENVSLADAEVNNPDDIEENIGGLVGYNEGTVNGTSVSGNVSGTVSGTYHVGGVVGQNTGSVDDSSASANVSGTERVGGLVGFNTGTVNSSDATGNVSGQDDVGGLVGENDGGAVHSTYATGNVTGSSSNVGGLVGWNREGTVEQSYAIGDVSANDGQVGGLVGQNTGTIDASYASGNVSGDNDVGGLVGYDSEGMITSSYATGTVTGNSSVGGVIGITYGGTVINSYWDIETTNQSTSDGGTGLTTAEMTGGAAVEYMDGLDFDTTWTTVDGENVSYPSLLNNTQQPAPGLQAALFADGVGTDTDPWHIADWTHLDNVGDTPGANFTVVTDLNESTTGYDEVANATANGGKGFEPIGSDTATFNGTFDGSNHTITGLYIDRSRDSADGTGLFGRTGSGALLQNLSLADADVNNPDIYNNIGGLVGRNSGTVKGSSVSGDISGTAFKNGGLVGYNDGGTVKFSNTTANVSGSEDVGGLVGFNRGTVNSSYAAGNLSSPNANKLGGLVGSNDGTVKMSSVTGNVSGNSQVGGLVGSNTGTVASSNATGTVSGDGSTIGGLVGYNDGTVERSYATGSVSSSDIHVGGLVGNNVGTVKRSYATGSVSSSTDHVGGLIGYDLGTVAQAYATGNVSGDSEVGGLVGWHDEGTVSDGYWDVNTTNQSDGIGLGSGDVTGLTTDQLKGNESLDGFDYTSTWAIYNASQVSYPYLQVNTQTPAPGLESVSTSGPYFDVRIADVNASVTAGDDVVVDAKIENTGSASGTQMINLTVNGTTEENRSVTLDASESTTEKFTYATSTGDTPAIEVGVESENETATTEEVGVSEPPSGSVSLNQSIYSEERGDVATIALLLSNTDTATVTIGTVGANNWAQNVTVEDGDDDDFVALEFNTYTAGTSDNGYRVYSTADDADSVVDVESDSGAFDANDNVSTPSEKTLGADDYAVSAVAGTTPPSETADGEDATGTLQLSERSTDSVTTYVAPESRASDIADGSDISMLQSDDNITESSVVVDGDVLLTRIDASGLEGVLANRTAGDSPNATAAFFEETDSDSAAWEFFINQTNPGANVDAYSATLNRSTSDLIVDANDDIYWLVIDTDRVAEFSAGNELVTNFTTSDADGVNDDTTTVRDEWSFEEPTATVDTNADIDNDGVVDEVLVDKAAGQTISGTANVAPGTELTIRVTGTDEGNPFVEPLTTYVQPDGTWSTTADFSGNEQGANFTIDVKRDNEQIIDQLVDGRIGDTSASITFNDQESFGSTVTVESVTMSDGGFVAMHRDNASGTVIGNSDYIESGSDSDVEITLDSTLDEDTTVVAMPHQDTDGDEQFEFESGFSVDEPYTENGTAVTDSAAITVTSTSDPYFDVRIADVNESVTAGEDVVVVATVENTGGERGTQTVELIVNSTTETSRSVSLNASETTTETFSYTTESGDTPAIEVGVASENDTATTTVTVDTAPATIRTATEANGTVELVTDEPAAVESNSLQVFLDGTEIYNASDGTASGPIDGVTLSPSPGTASRNHTITLTSGGSPVDIDPTRNLTVVVGLERTVDGQTVTAQESQAVTVTGAVVLESAGNDTVSNAQRIYRGAPIAFHADRSGNDTEVYLNATGHDLSTAQYSRMLTVDSADSQFDTGEIVEVEFDSNSSNLEYFVLRDLNWSVAARQTTVSNESTLNVDVTALRGGEPFTANLENDAGDVVATRQQSLAAGGSTTLTFDPQKIDGLNADESPYTVTATDNQTTNTATTDEITVSNTPPGNFSVSIESTNAPVSPGETLSVTATVTNEGNITTTRTVTLADIDGLQVDSQSVTLDGGNSTTVTLEWGTESSDAGSGDMTVASESDTDTAAVSFESALTDSPGIQSTIEAGGGIEIVTNETTAIESNSLQVFLDGSEIYNASDGTTAGPIDNTTVTPSTGTGATNHTITLLSSGSPVDIDPIRNLTVAFDLSFEDSTAETTHVSGQATVTSAVIDESDGIDDPINAKRIYRGAPIAIRSDLAGTNTGVFINATGQDLSTGPNSKIVVLDPASSQFDTGEIVELEFDNTSSNVEYFELRDLGWSVAANTTAVSDETAFEIDVTALRGGKPFTAVLENDAGEVVTTREQTLAGDGSTTLTFDPQKIDGLNADDGPYTVTATDNLTTNTATTDKITVLEKTTASFSVSVTDVNASVTAGGDVVVDARIENTGGESGTQTIKLTVNGTTEANRSVTLDASESTTETFTYATGSDDTPAIEVSVASKNDTATQTVSVAPPDTYAGGLGTESDPYEIANWYHLNNTRDNLGANFTLVADLNESTVGYDDVASDTSNSGKGFVPIGDSPTAFTGSFDGANHTITGLYIDRARPDTDGTGLFGNTGVEAIIENVGLEDADVSNANNRVGTLVGNNTGTVNSAYSTGNVSGSGKVGGLVGENKDGGTVNASHSTATVSSDSDCIVLDGCYVGGLVGDNGGTVDRSYATGTVSGSNKTGGLIGQNSGTAELSYATGPVSGDTEVGGLVGENTAYGTVKSSYATGNVSGNDSVGGFVGDNVGTVKSSYTAGPVSGDTDVGGLVGFDDQGTVTDAYWDVNTTNQTDGIGKATQYTDNDSTGLTTDQLKANTSLAGFDFENTWEVFDNPTHISYPYLRNNTQSPAPGLQEGLNISVNSSSQSPQVDVEGKNIPDGANLSVNVTSQKSSGESASFRLLNMTVHNETSFKINITHSKSPIGGNDAQSYSSNSQNPLEYVRLNHSTSTPESVYDNTTIEFRVRKDSLPSNAGAGDVKLYRYNTTQSQWNEMNITQTGESNTYYFYKADTPGFSQFVVTVPSTSTSTQTSTGGGSGDVEPDFDVTTAGVSPIQTTVGEEVTVEAVVENTGSTGTYTASLIVDGETVETKDTEVRILKQRTVRFSHIFDETGSYTVSVDGTTAGTVDVEPKNTTADEPDDDSTVSDGSQDQTTETETDQDVQEGDDRQDQTTDQQQQQETTDEQQQEQGEGQPGFGVVAAVLAFVFSLLIGLYRR